MSCINELKQATDSEVTFAKLNLNKNIPEVTCLTIQCPKGLLISIPPGIDASTLEIVMNSLWRLPPC